MNFHLKEWVKTVCPVKSCLGHSTLIPALKKKGGSICVIH